MDIRTLISKVRASGLSQREIAEEVGSSQSAISKLANGVCKQMLSVAHAKLVALHAKRCLPRRRMQNAN